MPIWTIRVAQSSDRSDLAKMRSQLWPDTPVEEIVRELNLALSDRAAGTLPSAILIAQDANGGLIGFLEVGLRSHADGCDPSQPSGFVEGWFVREDFRARGVGRELMQAAEAWARGQGCLEMGSDSLIDNSGAHRAHQALGFEVVDRCVHFKKKL
jgi:aminoglycoside 6'-N-acetyltransferase I